MSASTNPNENQASDMPMMSAGGPGGGGIPDLMKIGSIPVNTVQEVETAILEPVVKSNTFCRFVLPNKGLLHSHSKIEIGLKNSAEDAILPVNVGAYAFIQRVALKIGNQTISEVDDFAHYYGYRSLFVSNENMKEREQMTTGRCNSWGFAYTDRTGTTNDGAGGSTISTGGESDSVATGISLDNGRDADVSAPALVDTTGKYSPNSWSLIKQGADADTNLYQLSLAELVPFLRHNQLPLYLIKEQVALELTFSWKGDGNQPTGRVVSDVLGGTYDIDEDKLRMISDHIFYPQELMLQYAQANSVLNFTYADYRLSKYSVARADAQSQMIRNVGGAGRVVSKLIWGMQNEGKLNDGGKNEKNLQNQYHSIAPARVYAGTFATDKNGTAEFNIKYNDNFEFPIDVKNPARHFHNVNQAEGMVPFINRELYSREGETLSTRQYFGYNQSDNLSGRMFYLAQKLTKQERINSRGIELYFRYDDLPNNSPNGFGTAYVQRVWLEVLRTATIQNGYTECYYA
jgi:hypothetical protein